MSMKNGGLSRHSILERVKQIVLDNLDCQTATVYLFGSWARGEEKRSSDIDIAIEFDPTVTEIQIVLMNIRHALEESTIPYKVDVVDLNSADRIMVNKVREEGVRWSDQGND